jgi:hypothetical protein
MGCLLLAIDGWDAMLPTKTNQRCKCDFGRFTLQRTHGFSEHRFADRYTVQAPHQISIQPAFDAMGFTQLVQISISHHHFWLNPRPDLTRSYRLGTKPDGTGSPGGEPKGDRPNPGCNIEVGRRHRTDAKAQLVI